MAKSLRAQCLRQAAASATMHPAKAIELGWVFVSFRHWQDLAKAPDGLPRYRTTCRGRTLRGIVAMPEHIAKPFIVAGIGNILRGTGTDLMTYHSG